MVRARAVASMCATISISPLSASVAMAMMRPFASKRGDRAVPVSTVSSSRRGANIVSVMAGLAWSAAGARRGGRPLGAGEGAVDLRQEAHLLLRVVPEGSGELGGDGVGAVGVGAAQRHALVLGLHQH